MLTWKGAQSLALDNLGKIALGQRADLLFYADSVQAVSSRGQSASDLFMRCITRSRPLAVYVNGQPVASAGHV
jgi:cytosine/adenosine deaminase-related metal-dependent hydrolase